MLNILRILGVTALLYHFAALWKHILSEAQQQRAPDVRWIQKEYLLFLLGIFFLALVHGILTWRKGRCNISLHPLSPVETAIVGRPSPFSVLVVSLLFLAIVFFLKRIDIAWTHFDQAGPLIIGYTACRVLLMGYLFLVIMSLGSMVLKRILGEGSIDLGKQVILSFFLGASLLSLVLTTLGLLGQLNLFVALSLTLPVIYFSFPSFWNQCHFLKKIRFDLFSLSQLWGLLLIWIPFALCTAMHLVTPATLDNDTWEHYLPYYRMVTETGSVGPHALWQHFFISKGAGLFFLSILLGDPMAPQLVSFLFFSVMAFLLYHSLKWSLKEDLWCSMSVCLLPILSYTRFFKLHTLNAAYFAFLAWSTAQIIATESPREKRALVFTASLSSLYLCFSQPPLTLILFLFITSLLTVSLFKKTWIPSLKPLAIILVTGLLGMGVALILNYAMTGMAELVPFQFFLRIADQAKAERVLGGFSIVSSLKEQAGVFSFQSLPWLAQVSRLSMFRLLFPTYACILAAGIGILSWKKSGQGLSLQCPVLFWVILIFLVNVVTIAYFVQVGSLYRIFSSFLPFFFIFLWATLMKGIADVLVPVRWRRLFLPLLLTLIFFFTVTIFFARFGRNTWELARGLLAGQHSFAHALQLVEQQEMEEPYQVGTIEGIPMIPTFVSANTLYQIRRIIGPEVKIFGLSAVGLPAASFPGKGLLQEPTYNLEGFRSEDMISPSPDRTQQEFKKIGINFFLLNTKIGIRPFTGAYESPLFQKENLPRYFKVLFSDGENVLLTWSDFNGS